MKLAEYRKIHGLTQVQFGALIGVTGLTISRYELGATRPDMSMMEIIAMATKMEVLPNDWTDIITRVGK